MIKLSILNVLLLTITLLSSAQAADAVQSTVLVIPEIAPSSVTLSEQEVARRNRNVILGGGLAIGLYGATHWWKDGVTNNFRTVDEGWFGQDTYAGGADKMGHLYFTYAGTRLLTRCFEGLGNNSDQALWLGAATTFGTLLAVETIDGFSERWRFSKEDLVMNAIGSGLGILFEKSPELDKALDLRILYWPSAAAKRQDKSDPFGDYSGQTYLLVAKAAALPALRQHQPLRYLELAVGYGTRGYEPNEGAGAVRSRHGYVGISLNLAEILDDTLFKDSRNSRSQRITHQVLEYVQVPGTAAALVDHSF